MTQNITDHAMAMTYVSYINTQVATKERDTLTHYNKAIVALKGELPKTVVSKKVVEIVELRSMHVKMLNDLACCQSEKYSTWKLTERLKAAYGYSISFIQGTGHSGCVCSSQLTVAKESRTPRTTKINSV